MNKTGNQRRSGTLDGVIAWQTLGMLTFAYALSYVDRQLLSLVVDPIKTSLKISDTQFSFVQGTAFVVAYLAAAPLFGRLVDVKKRRSILIFGVSTWSICTALCGFASTYAELFMARVGVGFGEACIFPVAMSMIADSFSRARTPRAMSIFTLGTQLGGGFSLIAGGLVIAFSENLSQSIPLFRSFEKWQMAFIVVGLPGLIFAASLFLVPEPERGRGGTETGVLEHISLREGLARFWRDRGFYGRFYGAISCAAIVQLGLALWYPSILIRVQGMSITETGLKLGIISIVIGTVGTIVGPNIAQFFIRRGHPNGAWRTAWISMSLAVVACFCVPFMHNQVGALVLAGCLYFLTAVPLGAVIASMQNVTHGRMRGLAASLQTFSAQFVGYMIAPTLMAGMTDYVFRDTTMIDHSFQIVTAIAAAISALMYVTIQRPYTALLESEARRDSM